MKYIKKSTSSWEILDSVPMQKKSYVYLRCRCTCGIEREVRIVQGKLRSPRCHSLCTGIQKATKQSSYKSWSSMIERCYLKTNKNYVDYGGRGILVHSAWLEFKNFYTDMGEKPPKTLLDRIDNNQGYSKENCRWVNTYTSNQNKRDTINLYVGGVLMCLKKACRILGVNYGSVKRNWYETCKSPEEYILSLIANGYSTCATLVE